MMWSILGFVLSLAVFTAGIWWIVRFVSNKFFAFEERMADKQFIARMEDPEANRTICDGLAAFGPGATHIWTGSVACASVVVTVPFFHLLYTLWVRFVMTFTDLPVERAEVFHTNITQIKSYMPAVAAYTVIFALAGAFYAVRRRYHLQTDRTYPIINLPATEFTGMVVGWLLYYLVAVLPFTTGSWDKNLSGMLTLGGGWLWVGSGLLMTIYLRAAHNALLWASYRYRWPSAVPAIIQMISLRSLKQPPTIIKKVELDEPQGAAVISAQVDAIDADRLRDAVFAVPGLRRPQVIALGPPAGAPVRIGTQLAPRMKPLPPRAFKRKEGPPKGYGAEANLLDSVDTAENQTSSPSGNRRERFS